jgi:hypothetical protein
VKRRQSAGHHPELSGRSAHIGGINFPARLQIQLGRVRKSRLKHVECDPRASPLVSSPFQSLLMGLRSDKWIGDRMQIMHSGSSQNLVRAPRPQGAAGACI